jgi:hypothetical protein
LSLIQIIYRIKIGQGDDAMESKSKFGVPINSSLAPRSQDRRQTSEEELEEVRKRGRYVVLPSFEGSQEEVVDWDVLIF